MLTPILTSILTPHSNGHKRLIDIYDDFANRHGEYSAPLYLIGWLRRQQAHALRNVHVLQKGLIIELSRYYADRDLSILQATTVAEKKDALRVWAVIIRNYITANDYMR